MTPALLELVRLPLFLQSVIFAWSRELNVKEFLIDHVGRYQIWRGHSRSEVPADVPMDAINGAMARLALDMTLNRRMWEGTERLSEIASEIATPEGSAALVRVMSNIDPLEFSGDSFRFRHSGYQDSYAARALVALLEIPAAFTASFDAVLRSSRAPGVISDLIARLDEQQFARLIDVAGPERVPQIFALVPDAVSLHIRSFTIDQGSVQSLVNKLLQVRGFLQRSDRERRNILVISIHGFNTRGDWKNTLGLVLSKETDGERFLYAAWDYGVFRAGILNPFARRERVRQFQAFYNETLKGTSGQLEVCIVAHSFGTHIAGHAIQRFPEVKVDRLLLLGSVLPRRYDWAAVKHRCGSVLNIVGGADFALKAARAVPGLGTAGRRGFKEPASYVTEHFEPYVGHGDLFGERYMHETWVPFIRDGTVPAC